MHSHISKDKPSDVELKVRLTVAECGLAVGSGLWLGPDGAFHPVQSNAVNILHFTELGSLRVDSSGVSCTGMEAKFGEAIDKGTLVISQYKLIILPKVKLSTHTHCKSKYPQQGKVNFKTRDLSVMEDWSNIGSNERSAGGKYSN